MTRNVREEREGGICERREGASLDGGDGEERDCDKNVVIFTTFFHFFS